MSIIDTNLLKKICADVDSALGQIAAKYGLEKLRGGRCTYSKEGSFSFKVEGVASGGLDKDAERYNFYADLMNLPPLNSTFHYGGAEYTVVGLSKTRTKVLLRTAGSPSNSLRSCLHLNAFRMVYDAQQLKKEVR